MDFSKIPSAEPPPIQEHHVRVPDQLAIALRADIAHRAGYDGRGIRIAVIDSGFHPHPFYEVRGYRINRIATRREPRPQDDEYGHGTAQLASLFSIAPGAEVLAIKCMDRDPCYALRKALALKPHILNCAWGYNIDKPRLRKLPEEFHQVRKLLVRAVERGICVVAAAGNGQRCFPGNMPEVISAGGVFYTADGRFEPSDVSSDFVSSIFPGRKVPDLCGLVGNLPHGRLLLVPIPPRAQLARRDSFAAIMKGQASALPAHGWAMFSGTSAATAMVSGAAALLLQKDPRLTPFEIRRILMETARLAPANQARVLTLDVALGLGTVQH